MSRQFKVFLSSSFQDMHEERDYLKYHAFAALQAELFQKGVDLQILDLRGTTMQPDLSEEEAVLRLCLDGVEECVPRMVALLGDRYGWIPYGEGARYLDENAKDRAALSVQNISDAPGLDIVEEEIAGRSVTHLEIYYGLKRMPHEDIFIYQRTGLPYDKMSEAQRAVYCAGYEAQQAMKSEIQEKMGEHPHNIHDYSADWDHENGIVTGLEALDATIYADLKASFDKELAETPPKQNSWKQDSADILTALARTTMRRNAAGDPDPSPEFNENLFRIIERAGFYWVTGGSGSGVTTYTAQLCYSLSLYADWRERNGERPVLVVKYISESHPYMPTADILLTQLLEQLEDDAVALCPEDEQQELFSAIDASIVLHDAYSDDRNDNAKRDAVVESMSAILRRFLTLLHDAYDIFLVLCDVDMLLTDDDKNKTLFWLADMPPDVTIIVSAAEDRLTPCVNYEVIRVPPLTDLIIRDILSQTASEYGKRFSEEILELASVKLLSSGYSTALHARVLAESLMSMTGSDYLAFSGPDAHLSFMKKMIGRISDYPDGVFDMLIHRAKEAYGALAMNALRLLWVSRTAIPDSLFREALSVNLGRDVSELELFSLRGYLRSNLKNQRGVVTWQFAHHYLIGVLMLHIGDAVVDSAAAMLQTLRNHLSEHPFILSEFLWYGYWAGDPSAVAEYADAFYDNETARQAMVLLFHKNMNSNEGDWFSYMIKAIEHLRQDPGGLCRIYCTFCLIAPDDEYDFKAYDKMMKAYLTAADEVLPEKISVQLHLKYLYWLLTSDIVKQDMPRRLDVLRLLEDTSLKAAGHYDSEDESDIKKRVDYLSVAAYAQTTLCDNTIFDNQEYAKECFTRAASTFTQIGDDGACYLIEDGNSSFLDTVGDYFIMHFIVLGHYPPDLTDKLNTYIRLIEEQSQSRNNQVTLFHLYDIAVKALPESKTSLGLTADNAYISVAEEDKIFQYKKKLVQLGNSLYPHMLRSKDFTATYLQALLSLETEQVTRSLTEDASQTCQAYYETISNLHANKLMTDDEVADSSVYKLTEEYVNYGLDEYADDWRNLTEFLEQVAGWVDRCRPDALRLSIRRATILLVKVKYAALSDDYDEAEAEYSLLEAVSFIAQLPGLLSEHTPTDKSDTYFRVVLYDSLCLLTNAVIELMSRGMLIDAQQPLALFSRLCLDYLDTSPEPMKIKNSRSDLSEGYSLHIETQLSTSHRVGQELVLILIEMMECFVEPDQTKIKKQLSSIRKAVQNHKRS